MLNRLPAWTLCSVFVCATVFCLSSWAWADDGHQNHFASIMLDGKKIGHVHYSVKRDEQGEVEELRTKASLSVLGIKLYDFTQHLHEQWSGGALQRVWGNTNDDGKIDQITLKRMPNRYDATRNGEPSTLPHDAFPISLWHYAVSQQSLLFDLSNLRLLNVKVAKHQDTVVRSGKITKAERFNFTGGWKGSVWFDHDRQFLKAEYESEKRLITVVMDP